MTVNPFDVRRTNHSPGHVDPRLSRNRRRQRGYAVPRMHRIQCLELMKIHAPVLVQLRLAGKVCIEVVSDSRILPFHLRHRLRKKIILVVLRVLKERIQRFLNQPELYSGQQQAADNIVPRHLFSVARGRIKPSDRLIDFYIHRLVLRRNLSRTYFHARKGRNITYRL